MTARDDKRREDVLDVRNQMAARAIQWERQPGIHNGVTIAEELRWWIDRFDEAMPASTPSHVGECGAKPSSYGGGAACDQKWHCEECGDVTDTTRCPKGRQNATLAAIASAPSATERNAIIEEIAGETKVCEQCHRWRLTDEQIRALKRPTDGGKACSCGATAGQYHAAGCGYEGVFNG